MEDEKEVTHKDAKAEYEYWLESYMDEKRSYPHEFPFKYGIEASPDVLAYLILAEEERKKFSN